MRNLRILLLPAFVALITFFVSCSTDPADLTVNGSDNQATVKSTQLTKQANALSAHQAERLEKYQYFKNKLNSGEDISDELALYIINDPLPEKVNEQNALIIKNVILRAIDADKYACATSTPLNDYLDASTADWGLGEILAYYYLSYHPQFDAIYLEDPSARNELGIDGEYTPELYRTLKSMQRFWDIDGSSIGLVPYTGKVYKDIEKIALIESYYYPDNTAEENLSSAETLNFIFGYETFWNFKHPLLSFNAFAISYDGEEYGYYVGNRIAMGDGIMMAFEAIGLGETAPIAILAHEYAHQVQTAKGYFDIDAPEDEAEATRRTELMADAFASYFLTHKRGAAMNWWRVSQFLDVFYQIGDCNVTESGHHGTHFQRMAAAKWGYNLAQKAKKNGHILPTETVYALFQASLDDIINCSNCF